MKALGLTRPLRAAATAAILYAVSISVSQSWAFDPIGGPDPLGDLGPRIVAAEGGSGRNPFSSAAGYGQFLSGTWLEIFERAYPQVARTLSREQILALRDVKPLAEDLTARYAQANAATLRSLGLPATAGELSLAHAIGPHGAVSVLTAEPARPAVELLRPEAIAANPVLKGMTANALRQWATIRVAAPSGQLSESGAPNSQPRLELAPTDDFGFDKRTEASGPLGTNRDPGAILQDLVDALSKAGGGNGMQLRSSAIAWLLSVGVEPIQLLRGDPAAGRIFDRAASQVALDAVRSLSDRPSFREFKAIELHAAGRGELPRHVVRALAIALLDKMNRENSIMIKIVQHRRSTGRSQPSVGRSVYPPLRDAANASAPAASPPL